MIRSLALRRTSLVLASLTIVGIVGLALPAVAQPAPAQAAAVALPVSGTATNGSGASSPVTGTFTPERALRHGDGVVVLGRLTLNTANGTVTRMVQMPVQLPSTGPASPRAAAVTPQAVCQVLNLTLGPLHLNLLGLVIDLNQVVLNLTANPAGGLLGQLLCSLAGGLGGGALSNLLNQITNLLNQILGAL